MNRALLIAFVDPREKYLKLSRDSTPEIDGKGSSMLPFELFEK
jgi:hypothetical protein